MNPVTSNPSATPASEPALKGTVTNPMFDEILSRFRRRLNCLEDKSSDQDFLRNTLAIMLESYLAQLDALDCTCTELGDRCFIFD